MATSTFQSAKLDVLSIVGLSKDALHIYVGLIVFFAAVVILRKPVRSWIPLALVLLIAMLGEAFDARDDIADLGYWRIAASFHDILNTTFWPATLFVLSRYTRMLK